MSDAHHTIPTLATRYDAAMRDLRAYGFYVRRNVQKCCRSCVTFPLWKEEECQPLLWTYGGQGAALSFWADTVEYRATEQPATHVYMNHANIGPEEWEFIRDTFYRHGIEVVWDGSDISCITVRFDRSVSPQSGRWDGYRYVDHYAAGAA